MTGTPKHIASIELFRVIACFAVIVTHTLPFFHLGNKEPHYQRLFYIVNHVCRFDIPFFLITLGFFYGEKIRQGFQLKTLCTAYLKRYVFLYASWLVIFTVFIYKIPALPPGKAVDVMTWIWAGPHAALYRLKTSPLNFIFEGPQMILWFLPAVICAVWIITRFLEARKPKALAVCSILLLAFGLSGHYYSKTPLGIPIALNTFNTLNGPFFSTFLVSLGIWISQKNIRIPALTAAGLLLLGFFIQEAEAFILWNFFNTVPIFDILIGSMVYGAGFFLLALSKPDWGNTPWIQKLGALTLGIYFCQPYVITYVRLLNVYFDYKLWQVIFPVLVLAASALLTILLLMNPFTARLVSRPGSSQKDNTTSA